MINRCVVRFLAPSGVRMYPRVALLSASMVGKRMEELDTPSLIVDLDAIDHNITVMASKLYVGVGSGERCVGSEWSEWSEWRE